MVEMMAELSVVQMAVVMVEKMADKTVETKGAMLAVM